MRSLIKYLDYKTTLGNLILFILKNLGIQLEFELVHQKSNAEADRLATQALNGIDITATSEMTGD